MTSGALPAGTIDLHVHTAPDTQARCVDDLTLAREGPARGLSGAVLKCHDAPTAGRAWIVRREEPDFAACGAIVLNHAVGGLNVRAVEAFARLGGSASRFVWLPTRDAESHIVRKGKHGQPVAVMEDGKPTRALLAIAEAAAHHGLVLASGHVAPGETLAILAALAPLRGPFVATHVTARVTPFSRDEIAECLRLGAIVEICARNLLMPSAHAPVPHTDRVAETVAILHDFSGAPFVLSSDLGDPRYPHPVDGLAAIAAALSGAGVSDTLLENMLVRTPRILAGVESASAMADAASSPALESAPDE